MPSAASDRAEAMSDRIKRPFLKESRLPRPLAFQATDWPLIGSGVRKKLTGVTASLKSAQIQPGNSGGPVLDRYGSVTGVIVAEENSFS